ncbi:MAG: hypothetical protein OEU50_10735 [Gammaproteobacteria bacterium]|nr:hypothetical protein [Gammaproteobacteria bacterium]
MGPRRLFISITIVMLSTLALYLLVAWQLLRDPPQESLPADKIGTATAVANAPREEPIEAGAALTVTDPRPVPVADKQAGGRKILEIFGRVTDTDGQPIEDALIAEERYFASTRSDDTGRYRVLLDIPRHRYPNLHFLRNGYDGRRIRLGKKELQQTPLYELDVSLEDALDSVDLEGWIGNEAGFGLEGARVELSASYTRNRDSFYLTDFTDSSGNFAFEGVRSGETYKFSVNLTPEYPYYEDLDFHVTQNPERINIVLRKLSFVDIDGMLLDRGSTPVPNYEMYISNVTTGIHTRKIISDSSGYFTLPNFPLGEVRLSTRGAEFFKISGLEITEKSYHNLKLVVDRGNHYLYGWISDDNGVAVDKAMVTLDRKFRNGKIEHSSYRSQGTDSNGGFAFENLGDGEYHVTVYALGYEKQDFYHRFDGQTDEIYVTLKRN